MSPENFSDSIGITDQAAEQLKAALDISGQINFDRVQKSLLDFRDCWLGEFANPKLIKGQAENVRNFIVEFERILEVMNYQYETGNFNEQVIQYFKALIRSILDHPNFDIVRQSRRYHLLRSKIGELLDLQE